ncbi:MAG: hypothetical protein Q4E07_04695 [Eubacteriales bacterium]|nr:hypothetical protein [Eubacteriales bacterium]
MSNLSEKVAYLKGLAEGMNLSEENPANKLLLSMVDVLDEFAHSHDELADQVDELDDYIEEIDEDLQDIEELFSDEYEDECESCGLHLHHGDDDDDFHGSIDMDCPNCGKSVVLEEDDFDTDEDILCPFCGKSLFPELSDEDFEDEEEDD